MGNVVDFTAQKRKKQLEDVNLDTDNLLLCFNGNQFMEILNKILSSEKRVDEVLKDNSNLYKIGYFDKNTRKVDVLQ